MIIKFLEKSELKIGEQMLKQRAYNISNIFRKLFVREVVADALCDKSLTALDSSASDCVEFTTRCVLQNVRDCRVVAVTDVKSAGVGGLVLCGVHTLQNTGG